MKENLFGSRLIVIAVLMIFFLKVFHALLVGHVLNLLHYIIVKKRATLIVLMCIYYIFFR